MWVKHPIFLTISFWATKDRHEFGYHSCVIVLADIHLRSVYFSLLVHNQGIFSCSGSSSPVVNRNYKCFKFHKHEFSILEGLWSFYLQNIISWRLRTFSELGRMLVCGRMVSWLFKQYPFIKYTCLGVLELHNFLASKFLRIWNVIPVFLCIRKYLYRDIFKA